MVLLRRLEITGFRGAIGALPVDLTSACRSIAIFGENAAGKSSLTDAIEWFYTDRVDHLWKENTKESALRNALIGDKTSSTVALELNKTSLNCKKSLSPQLVSSLTNKTKECSDYLSQFQQGRERLTLRNMDLLNFILKRKADKRQELERIIGYEALDTFRDAIGQTLYKLERTPEYIASQSSTQDYQKEIIRIARASIFSEKELYDSAERMVQDAGISLKIADDNSYETAIKEIQAKIHDKEKTTRKLALSECKQKCGDLSKKATETLVSFDLFSTSYAEVIKSEEQLKQVKLVEFLTQGKQAIDDHLVPDDTCPLCLQTKAWDSLRQELGDRIAKLQESKRQYDAAYTKKNQTLAKLNEAVRAGHELISYSTKAGIEGTFLHASEKYNVALKELERHIGQQFDVYHAISGNLGEATKTIVELLKSESERLGIEESTLALSTEEQKLLESLKAIENLRSYYHKFRAASETGRKFETQIKTLSKIKTDFSIIHTAALQKVLDLMSSDISRYYLAMHPNENVDDIRLTVLEEGVEFDYGFHGKRAYPPLKYLSESHLNSLGIAAFLASVKLFNKINGFFVLDDIVTSFDANHRIRLSHLLRTEFSKWQIILLTHEPFWFELIKKEMAPNGWLFSELEAAPTVGTTLKSSSKDLREHITSKWNDATLTANELRTAMERMLKDIGLCLEVKVAFRFNDQNERRMPGELLSELRSTLKKKSPGTLANPAFTKVETCSLVATTGSHDSGPVLSSGDVSTCCEDFLTLDDLFYCKLCSTYVMTERLVGHENKIYCRCGKKHLDWKE